MRQRTQREPALVAAELEIFSVRDEEDSWEYQNDLDREM